MRRLNQTGAVEIMIIVIMAAVIIGLIAYIALSDNEDSDTASQSEIEAIEAQIQNTQLRARDVERRTDINAISVQLEVYFADNLFYPDGSTDGYELSTVNLVGLDSQALLDPDGNPLIIGSDPRTATENGYHFISTGCSDGRCTGFSLGVLLEESGEPDDRYIKDSLN